VLHFDINNTILMRDAAKGLNCVQYNVARIITKSAWGKVNPPVESDEKGLPTWQIGHDQLSWSYPENPSSHAILIANGETPPKLTNYYAFLKETYPTDGPNAEQNKAIIEDRIISFARPGGPGAKFKNQ
jgi:hypothetical protein